MSLNATLSVAEKHIYMVGFHSQQLRDILADVPDVGQKVTLFQQTSTTASSAIKASRSTTTTTTPPSPSFAGGGSGGGGGGLKWLQEQHLYARQLESGQLEVVDRHFNLSDLDAVSEGHETALATPPSLIFINAANKATARVIARHAKQLKIPVYIPDIPEYSDFQLHAASETAAVIGSGSSACQIDVLVNVKQSKYDQSWINIFETAVLESISKDKDFNRLISDAMDKFNSLSSHLIKAHEAKNNNNNKTSSSSSTTAAFSSTTAEEHDRAAAFLQSVAKLYGVYGLASLTRDEEILIAKAFVNQTPLPKLVSSQQHTTTSTFDKVYLIGSGPGEIDLLTRQAYQVLKKCSLVIADPQVPLSILSMIPADKLHVLSASSLQNLDDKAIKLAGSIFKKSTATGDNACIVRLVPGNGTAAADRIMANLHSVLGYEPKFIPGIGISSPSAATTTATSRNMTPNSSSPNLPAYSSFHSTRAHTPPFNLSHTTTAVDAPCVTSKSLFDIRVVKIKGVNMASNVCLSFSDITYVYPFLVTQKLDQESAMASWKANFQRNLVGRVPALVSLEAKFGSGAAIHGSLRAGAPASLMLPAANLKHILPTMHAICRDRLSTVFHVLTGALEADTFSLSAQDLSELVPVSYTGFSIIGSSSVQEVHDIGLAAHIVSRVLRAPVLHYFDGVAVGQQLNTVRSLEGENVLKSLVEYAESSLNDHHDTNGHGHIVPGASGISSTSSSVDVINTFERVLDILSPILFKTYRPIEYFGHAHPETLLISLTNLATPLIASTISSHLTTVPSDKIGFLSVRLMRPWSSAYFVKHVPKSVKRVVILDNTTQHDGPSAHGTFYLDVLSAFYGGQSHLAHVPSICTVYFEDESVDGVTEGSIKWLITDLLNDHKNGSKIKIPAVTLHHRHSLDEQEPGLVQAVFFDVLQQQLSTPIPDVADEVVKYLSSDSVSTRTCDDESSPSIQLDVGHKIGNLQSQTEPFLSKVSNLRYNLQPLSPIASLVSKISHSADYIGFHHPALVFIHGSDVLPRKNGIVVVNGPYKTIKQMVDAKMVTKETIHLWIQQNVTLIFIDVEKHVQDFTHFLFKKDTEKQLYVSLILQGAFYKFSSRGDSLHHHQHHHQTSVTLDPAAALHHLKTCIVDKVLDKGVKAGATLIGALEKSLAKAVIVQLDSQNRALLSAIDEIFPLVEHQESSSSSSTFRVSSSLVTQYAASINLTDEEDDDTVDQVAIKHHHHLAWAYLFPEAYQTEKTLRPDITEDAYLVKVSENRRLTPLDYDRNVFHIDFDTSGTELKYEVGEALGVHGHNDPEMVARFLKLYGLEADTVVEFARRDKVGRKKTELRTIEQVFIQLLDVFGKPGKKFYQSILEYTQDPKERQALADVINDADKFQKMINEETPDYADVLVHLYPSARVPLPVLLTLIPPIKPRHYSIASSMNMHPSSVHLLVVLVNWTAKTSGTEKVGQCTRFLSNLHPGATLAVTVRPSVMKLPPLHKQPIIMAGLGTGMAPFRAFIQERAYQRSNGVGVGPMLLYFGSRNRGNEYLYGEELEAYHKEGIITKMGLAFSRDQPQKIYIQHKMGEDKKLLGDLMLGEGPGNEENPPLSSSSSLLHHYIESLPQEKQGVFYLCGPTWPVPDVKEAMVKAFEGKGVDRNNASDLIELLKEEDRYILEVY